MYLIYTCDTRLVILIKILLKCTALLVKIQNLPEMNNKISKYKGVTREFQNICTKGRKANFVSKNDKNIIILSFFLTFYITHMRTVRI